MSTDSAVGLLFPGQGSQYVGMGKDLADHYPSVRECFHQADDALDFHLSRLCWDGPEDELTRTVNAQPAILVHSIAVWGLIEDAGLRVAMAAGHSLGEFSAYVAAGAIEYREAVQTVRRRGELMYRSGEQRTGTMAAVIGMEDMAVEAVCSEASVASGTVVPANFNAPGQVVISGDRAAVERAGELARQRGAKRVLPLNVSGAFHSPLMEVAEAGLRAKLDDIELADPVFPVVSNVTARPVHEAVEARRLLVEQLTSPVRWTSSIRTMRDAGIGRFLEIGPGSVLAGLLRRIDREADSESIGTVDAVERFSSVEST